MKKARRKPAAHLLIIECRTSLLHRQGLAIGTPLHCTLAAQYPGKTITLAATDTRHELTQRLGEIRTAHERYRAVVLVAHSNPHRLQLANDDFCTWTTLATWLQELAPEHLFLIACDAGQFTAACTLLAAVPSLRKLYASPGPINPDQAHHLNRLLRQVITDRRVDEPLLRLAQGINFLANRGVIFQWTRADCRPHNTLKGHALTIAAQLLK